MKIVATVSNYIQVSQDQFRDINESQIFDGNSTLNEIVGWAKSKNKNYNFHSIKFSVLDEGEQP